jgi:hypothetical protein
MRRHFGFLLAGALAFASPAAFAANDAATAQAGSLFKEGIRLYQAGDFENARVKFAAANALVKSDAVLWNLALAEAKTSRAADAMNHFRAYMKQPKARAADVQEAKTKWIPALDLQVGELQIDGADGATVTVDSGDPIGVMPLGGPYAVAPGHHHVEGRAGADVTSRDVDVAAGQTITVHLIGASPASPAAPAAPVAAVDAPPPQPASPVAPAPSAPTDDTTGEHASALRTWMTVGLGVVAVASLAGGIGFGAASKSEGNDAQSAGSGLGPSACVGTSPPAACATLKSDLDSQNHDHTISTVLYVGAGVFAAGALASWFFLPKTEPSRAAVVPMIGPGVAGASWVTSF